MLGGTPAREKAGNTGRGYKRRSAKRAEKQSAHMKGTQEERSGDQSADRFDELRLMQGVSEEDADQLSDTGEEEVGLDGGSAMGFAGIKDEGILEDIDGSFNGDPVAVKVVPVVGTSWDTGIEAKILVGVGVDALAVRGFGTGMLAGANAGGTLLDGGRANPFEALGTVFAAGFAEEGEGLAGNGANRGTGGVKMSVRGLGVSEIHGDAGTVKAEIAPEHGVDIVGIEGRIADKGLEDDGWVRGAEVGEYGFEGYGIADFLI